MARRHIDAAQRIETANGKRQLRRRAMRGENVRPDPVAGEDLRRKERKFLREIAAVVSEDHPARFVLTGCKDIIGDSLRSASHSQPVHPVRAGASDAAKACCPEFDLRVKALLDLILVILNGSQFFSHRIILRELRHPFIISVFVIHKLLLPSNNCTIHPCFSAFTVCIA